MFLRYSFLMKIANIYKSRGYSIRNSQVPITQLNYNQLVANKISHLLLILLPDCLKQITYLCQYVQTTKTLFKNVTMYYTTLKIHELYKISRKNTNLPTILYILISHLFSFYCLFKSGSK